MSDRRSSTSAAAHATEDASACRLAATVWPASPMTVFEGSLNDGKPSPKRMPSASHEVRNQISARTPSALAYLRIHRAMACRRVR